MHIPARDVPAPAGFYRDVFGWQLHGPPDGPSFSDGTGHVIGRWVTDQAVVGADGLRAYVYFADVEDTLDAVTARGGRVVMPRTRKARSGWSCSPTRRQRARHLARNLW